MRRLSQTPGRSWRESKTRRSSRAPRREFWWNSKEGTADAAADATVDALRAITAQLSHVGRSREESPASDVHVAVLFDADNTSHAALGAIMREVSRFGVASVRRSYGDFTHSRLASWKACLQEHAITPVQQFQNTTGKNASDSALIIDAMDLLHSRRYHSFCLVSSDSDFTRLATRIREDGLTVIGVGKATTPQSFKASCNQFITIETLQGGAATQLPRAHTNGDREHVLTQLREIVDENGDGDGWTRLDVVLLHMKRRDPAFDFRACGEKRVLSFSKFVEQFPEFEHQMKYSTRVVRRRH